MKLFPSLKIGLMICLVWTFLNQKISFVQLAQEEKSTLWKWMTLEEEEEEKIKPEHISTISNYFCILYYR